MVGGCTVVWWLAPSPHSKRVPGSTPGWGLSVWSLHVLPGYSGFLPPSENMHVRLIGFSTKLSLGVSVSVCGCLSLCGSVMDWWPVQGVPRLSPDDPWDRLQPPHDPTDGLSGYRKWMDLWWWFTIRLVMTLWHLVDLRLFKIPMLQVYQRIEKWSSYPFQ